MKYDDGIASSIARMDGWIGGWMGGFKCRITLKPDTWSTQQYFKNSPLHSNRQSTRLITDYMT